MELFSPLESPSGKTDGLSVFGATRKQIESLTVHSVTCVVNGFAVMMEQCEKHLTQRTLRTLRTQRRRELWVGSRRAGPGVRGRRPGTRAVVAHQKRT